MRIFSGVLGLIVLVLVLAFALSNKQDVTVALWPFKDSLQAPLYAIGLVPLALGFIVGSLQGWIGSLPHRLRLRRVSKELDSIKRNLGKVRVEESKRKSSFWSRS